MLNTALIISAIIMLQTHTHSHKLHHNTPSPPGQGEGGGSTSSSGRSGAEQHRDSGGGAPPVEPERCQLSDNIRSESDSQMFHLSETQTQELLV